MFRVTQGSSLDLPMEGNGFPYDASYYRDERLVMSILNC